MKKLRIAASESAPEAGQRQFERRARVADPKRDWSEHMAKTVGERFAECVKSCDPTPEEVAEAWAEWERLGGHL